MGQRLWDGFIAEIGGDEQALVASKRVWGRLSRRDISIIQTDRSGNLHGYLMGAQIYCKVAATRAGRTPSQPGRRRGWRRRHSPTRVLASTRIWHLVVCRSEHFASRRMPSRIVGTDRVNHG